MSILPQLEANKGTITSALGKSLANKVLRGETAILEQAVALLAHDNKEVRAGAAKIIEQVALVEPSLVAGFLPQLLPALETPEPQTRWMVIHTLGLCAAFDTPTALAALPKAKAFIKGNSGACLWGATIVYLGHVGATSETNARVVFPTLEHALYHIPRQTKKVLESFLRLLNQSDDQIRARIAQHIETHAQDEKPSIRKVARKIQKMMGEQ